MTASQTCPQCHQPLDPDAPDGLCPRCLLKAAVDPAPPTIPGETPADIIDIADAVEVAKRLPQFEIFELLGRGGMGVVYRARQRQLDRMVALKILPQVDALSPDFVARFTREARSLGRLNHPNIVHVHDFGETNGLYYIVMELVEGANLRQLLEVRKFTPADALAIIPEICEALQYAHEEGVVHRDIKPENLLVDKKGRVKVADFGLAKLLRRDALDVTLTMSGTALGTLRYMAPEQMDKPDAVDHRADLYSLGVVLYELLTGELPVGRFDLPSQKAPVDARLDKIVLHALEREPARRYQHASEVKQDVERVSTGAARDAASPGILAQPLASPADAAPGSSAAPQPSSPEAKRPRRHMLQSVLAVACLSTFFFGVNFGLSGQVVNGVRMHKFVIGSIEPWFVHDRQPLGFYQALNPVTWSFLVLLISCVIFVAICRIDNEDKGKSPRDPEWWKSFWKLSCFWCGLFLLGCILRRVL